MIVIILNMNEEKKRKHEKRVRWQNIRIEQLGYVNYIILILCSGLFAFQSNIIINNEINNTREVILIHSIIFIFISLLIGVFLAFNRLVSFKWTAIIARKEDENDSENIELYRLATTILDKVTWILVSLQLIFFLVGVYNILLFAIN